MRLATGGEILVSIRIAMWIQEYLNGFFFTIAGCDDFMNFADNSRSRR